MVPAVTREESSNWFMRGLLAAMVVVGAATLLAASVIVGVDSKSALEPDRPNRPSGPTSSVPAPVEGAGPAPTGDPTVDATLAEIARFVEAERGPAFQKPVAVEVLDDEQFEDRLMTTTEKDADELRKQAQALQALGFVDDVSEVENGMESLLAGGVLGFYDPETDELVVRGGSLTPMTRQTIAHELTHALDDQWFDLAQPEYEQSNDEVGFGISALAEGNARRIDQTYAARLDDADRETLQREESSGSLPPLLSVPPVLVELITAPYDYGEPLVRALLKQGEQPALDAAFQSPPRTSEQVIDTEKLFAGEGAIAVAAPPADGPVLDEGMFGELVLRLVLEQALGQGRVTRAATGWGGDHYVVWQQGGDYCLRVDFAADTADDLTETKNALTDTAEELPNAQVEQPQPDLVRLTSCN
jgi:hypothetical protein